MKPQPINKPLAPMKRETTNIGGMAISAASMEELAAMMVEDCHAMRQGKLPYAMAIFDANGQGLSLNQTDSAYREAMKGADLIHADGEFIVKMSKWRKGPVIKERSATTDYIWQAAKTAEEEGLSFYLLGGEPGLAEEAAEIISKKHPNLKILGHHHGYFSQAEERELIAKINQLQPDIIWVGLGKPREQIFCVNNKQSLKAGWLVTCGGCFNFVTGDYKRAPVWMQDMGLEWVHRLLTRPRSLFWRYAVTTPHALYLAITK